MIFDVDEPFVSHIQCRCTPIPVLPDVPVGATGADLFSRLEDAQQRGILGRGRFDLFKAGQMDITDIPVEVDAGRWGKALRQRTLGELKRGARLSIPQPNTVIQLPDGADDRLRGALDAIGQVHGLSSGAPISVREVTRGSRLGTYDYDFRTGKPKRIDIKTSSNEVELTLVHEIGHYIDHQVLPKKDFGDNVFRSLQARDEFMGEWRDAVNGSRAITAIRNQREQEPAYADYLLMPQEQWARSYAQYIATQSQNPTLLAQINKYRSDDVLFREHWDDDDFVPIADAIGRMFSGLGLK